MNRIFILPILSIHVKHGMTKRKSSPKKKSARSRNRAAGESSRSPLVTLLAMGLFGLIAVVMFTRIGQNGATQEFAPTAFVGTLPPVNQTVVGVAGALMPTTLPIPTRTPADAPTRPPATPRPTVNAASVSKRIGIVSGHRNNDSGSVCDDGLTEASLNFNHATRVAARLRAEGYTVDILDEFDDRLDWYASAAFVSIHADSCTYINDLATGFKVARAENSAVPQEEDRFVDCIKTRYQAATGLKFNASTITVNMTDYHAFRAMNPQTPAVIIETGFMNLDRATLVNRADAVAKGIADGILCFLRK